LELTHAENHEIMRCYGLCEYRYGNREKWLGLLKDSFSLNNKDAEVIYNLIELYILEHKYTKAKSMIDYYHRNHEKLQTIDKEITYYDKKVSLLERFVKTQIIFNINK
jgi:Tfp pilus assembly protein PilF